MSVLTAVGLGCAAPADLADSGRADAGSPASDPASAPTSLPDLSATDAFATEQIRAEHAALMDAIDTPDVDAATLAERHGDMGKLLMAAALPVGAEPYLRHAQRLAPNDFRWPYYLGHLHRSTGALADSVAAFERALELRPDDPVTLLMLGDVYLSQGRPDDAHVVFQRQLGQQPDSVVAHVGIGRAALARNEHERAIRHLEDAFRLSGETAVGVHYPLAVAYRALGDLDQAEHHMAQRADVAILPEDPLMEELETLVESPRAYEARGNRALSARDWSTAAEQFRRGLALDPSDPVLRHRLGTALFQMGDPQGAAAEFERVVRTTPEFVLAHFSLGVLLEGAGLRQEAIERFEAALEHDPDYLEARLGLAGLLRRQGRLEESLAQYERVMDQGLAGDVRVEEAPFGHAITLVHLGRYAEARDRLVDALETYPAQPFFVHALARLLSAAPDAAIRDGARALALMQELPEDARRLDLGETMAMTLAELGRFDDAARWQQDAIDSATGGGRADLVPRMRAKLARYESERPWRSDDPVEFDPFLERSVGAVR